MRERRNGRPLLSENHQEAFDYLLSIATPTQREDALGQMLATAISHVDWRSNPKIGWEGTSDRAEPDVKMIEKLARLGAKLFANNETQQLRAALRRADLRRALRIIRALASGPIADIDELRRVAKTKTILDRLERTELSREDRELLALKPSKQTSRGQARSMVQYLIPKKPWWPGQTFWQRRRSGY